MKLRYELIFKNTNIAIPINYTYGDHKIRYIDNPETDIEFYKNFIIQVQSNIGVNEMIIKDIDSNVIYNLMKTLISEWNILFKSILFDMIMNNNYSKAKLIIDSFILSLLLENKIIENDPVKVNQNFTLDKVTNIKQLIIELNINNNLFNSFRISKNNDITEVILENKSLSDWNDINDSKIFSIQENGINTFYKLLHSFYNNIDKCIYLRGVETNG